MSQLTQTDQFAILLDGEIDVTDRLTAQVQGRCVIAADGGIRHASPLGVAPHLWVGDFDSVSDDLLLRYGDVARETYPAAKAHSDGELAIARAIALGAADILLVGASGGARTDHILFNLLGLVRLAQQGAVSVWASSGTEEFHPLVAQQDFEPDMGNGTVFSIIGIDMAGLTITGARWPLEKVDVVLGSSLTLSNVVQGRLRIKLSSGVGLVVFQT